MKGQYKGEYDNLLYYFVFNYNLIQEKYKHTKKLFPRKTDYVKLNSGDCTKEDNVLTENVTRGGRKRRGKRENKQAPAPSKKQRKNASQDDGCYEGDCRSGGCQAEGCLDKGES
eukprot:TRINITY_DN6927_c0_g1_i2.p3 TRINITY_DN6927_c0_g1~~TRINITY_DN6927_c0_g1_i2.p3  ORF type:complete len:114 (+),score=33.69 TRINITY_DN6927_c0_g1_i2:707-1048(+)